ncbi:MAG: metallophosphoesterase [Calditrichia bacterium]|nr:metallophosphoesterase [Calditrichia bacterium]
MTRFKILLLILIIILSLVSCQKKTNEFENAFEFIVAADMRNYITDNSDGAKHFIGALEAIKSVGAGNFMISSGDIDPPEDVHNAIKQILGKEYPWYTVIGNHEIEDNDDMVFLREYNKNGTALPNVVKKGPEGCEETTYSFDWENCHFIALNQYYDGKSDVGTDGDIVPELFKWLEDDLSANSKKHIFVFGHEPIFPMPDMDNGRVRHYDDCLNKYMDNNIAFLQLLRKYNVIAYICGHTHNTSYANINGVWQIDSGHSRGLENKDPYKTFNKIIPGIEKNVKAGLKLNKAIDKFYTDFPKQKSVRKCLDFTDLSEGVYYKKMTDDQALKGLLRFYNEVQKGQPAIDSLKHKYLESANLARSTFMKFYVGDKNTKVEIYRDDANGGEYFLRKSIILY